MCKHITRLAVLLLCLGAIVANAADPALSGMDGDSIAQFHFVGTDAIASDPNAAKLNELGKLPATLTLRNEFLDKLSTAPFRFLKEKLANQNTYDCAPLIHPLVEDLLHNEWYAEFRGPSGTVPEMMLAVHLTDNHAKLWSGNLSTILISWTGIPTKQTSGDGFSGWELQKHDNPNLLRCLRAGDWLLFGWGEDELHLQSTFLQRIKASKRPAEELKNNWLDVLVNWPVVSAHRLVTIPPIFTTNLPKIHLTLEGRKDYVRPKLTMLFADNLDLKLEDWQLPADLMDGTIASFSATRGISSWLAQMKFIKDLHPYPIPNQFFTWAMSGVPFESCVGVPVKNASNYLNQIGPDLTSILNTYLTNENLRNGATFTNNQLRLKGVPFLVPYVQASHSKSGDFLVGGLFPSVKSETKIPLPKDLMSEISTKPNLVYYAWEINQIRLEQCHNIFNISQMAQGKILPTGKDPAQAWIVAAKTSLSNCGTEITLTAPNELTLIRNAPTGLTAWEMVLLSYWMDGPGFPFAPNYPVPAQETAPLPSGAH